MFEAKKIIYKDLRFRFSSLMLVTAAFLLTLVLSSQLSFAQERNQQVFRSPEEASGALFTAVQQADNRALLEILGAAGKDLITSGDRAEDMKERERFVAKYEQMHRIAKERSGVMILYVGAENWPLPIPLVERNNVWYFDTDMGKGEILARRVGRNELATIGVCYQLVSAQEQHYATAKNDEHRYALKFISDSDRRDGLFSSETGEQSATPLDPLIASAGIENATAGVDPAASRYPVPFNGYYFRILTAQGNNAEGGARSYIANGKMVGGFAFVAYPTVYRSSGVVTFIVNQNGILYQKDLGPNTEKIAGAMTEYDPDSSWHRVD
jgi:Protein of unknown function (DUF2950)